MLCHAEFSQARPLSLYGGSGGRGSLLNIGRGFPFATTLQASRRQDALRIQTYPLDFVALAASDVLYLGADVSFPLQGVGGAGASLQTVLEPGFSVDLAMSGGLNMLIAEGVARVGVESDVGVGVYIVPGLGLVVDDSNVELVVEGRLQASIWF